MITDSVKKRKFGKDIVNIFTSFKKFLIDDFFFNYKNSKMELVWRSLKIDILYIKVYYIIFK